MSVTRQKREKRMKRIGADDSVSGETNNPIRLSLFSSCLRVFVVMFNHKARSRSLARASFGAMLMARSRMSM